METLNSSINISKNPTTSHTQPSRSTSFYLLTCFLKLSTNSNLSIGVSTRGLPPVLILQDPPPLQVSSTADLDHLAVSHLSVFGIDHTKWRRRLWETLAKASSFPHIHYSFKTYLTRSWVFLQEKTMAEAEGSRRSTEYEILGRQGLGRD